MSKVLVSAAAKTVRQLRNAARLSQEELAGRADLDRTYLSGVERGVRNITLESLETIINALDMDLPAFLSAVNANLEARGDNPDG